MNIPTATMNEQMEPILDEVDVLLFTEAEIHTVMEEVEERVGVANSRLAYQIALNQSLRTALDPRFRKMLRRKNQG